MSFVHRSLAIGLAAGLVTAAGPSAAELEKWNQAEITALSKQLADATQQLYDTFYRQPPPSVGSMHARDYYRLKQVIRRLLEEADQLHADVAKGDGMEETLPAYDDLMEKVRDAREIWARVFTSKELRDSADAARGILNQISPYYDPGAVPLEAVAR